MMMIVATILLSFAVAWLLLQPHFASAAPEIRAEGSASLQALLDQKHRCVQILKDLDLDRSMEKLSEADYAQMKAALSYELSDILKKIDDSKKS